MRKRTITALKYTHITPESHLVLVALIDYAAQNPSIDPRNYGTWASFKEEANRVSRQWRQIVALIPVLEFYGVTDEQILDAAEYTWSGRYEWNADRQCWYYCTCSYFPVEYRAACLAILRAVLPTK